MATAKSQMHAYALLYWASREYVRRHGEEKFKQLVDSIKQNVAKYDERQGQVKQELRKEWLKVTSGKLYHNMATLPTMSLNAPINAHDKEGGDEVADHLATEDTVLAATQQASIKRLIERMESERVLPDREMLVIRLRFGIGCDEHTLEEVGGLLKVTRERTRQIEKKALLRLKRYCLRNGIKEDMIF